jgi:hypothetical protein
MCPIFLVTYFRSYFPNFEERRCIFPIKNVQVAKRERSKITVGQTLKVCHVIQVYIANTHVLRMDGT